jgi:hypothetical protein
MVAQRTRTPQGLSIHRPSPLLARLRAHHGLALRPASGPQVMPRLSQILTLAAEL